METPFLSRQSLSRTVNDFHRTSGWLIIRKKNGGLSAPRLSADDKEERSPYITDLLLCRAHFSICVRTLNAMPWAKHGDRFPFLAAPLVFKRTLWMRVGGREGWLSGDRNPMLNEKLPNGASPALHQGRWSWRGGCCKQMLKNCKPGNTSVQPGSLNAMKHTTPFSKQEIANLEAKWEVHWKNSYLEKDCNRWTVGACVASDSRYRN